MTTSEALLAAVIASPDDDTVRKAYADWCRENGHEERADFIAIQLRMAELRAECRCGGCRKSGQHHNGPCAIDRERVEMPDGRSRQAFLRREERAFLDLYAESWGCGWPDISTLPSNDQRPAVTFRRGFISEIRCTLADWCGGECGRCNPHLATYVPFNNDGMCLTCRDTGRTSGIGVQVSEKHPVQTVTLTDRDPAFGASPTFRWTDASEPNPLYSFRSHPQNQLPHDLFRLVNGNMKVPNQSPYIKWFPTKEYALSALSTALIVWAKSQNVTTKDYSDYHDHLAGGCLHGQPPASSFPT